MNFLSSFQLLIFLVTGGLAKALDGKELVAAAYEKEEALRKVSPRAGMVYTFEYLEEARYHQEGSSKIGTHKQAVKILSQNNNSYVSNGRVDMLQGPKQLVTIMKENKTIHITDRLPSDGDKQFSEQALLLRASALHEATLAGCSWVKEGRKNYRKVILRLPPAKKTGRQRDIVLNEMSQIQYLIDVSKQRLYQIKVIYQPKAMLESLSITIQDNGWRASSAVDLNTPLRAVFDKNNHLLAEYANYKVVDQRQR